MSEIWGVVHCNIPLGFLFFFRFLVLGFFFLDCSIVEDHF